MSCAALFSSGGSKDAGITHKDKDEQYAYQQER
jgi:hypothetical protein